MSATALSHTYTTETSAANSIQGGQSDAARIRSEDDCMLVVPIRALCSQGG